MPEPGIPEDEKRRIRATLHRGLSALQQRYGKVSIARVAEMTGYPAETVRSYFRAKRPPRPKFLRALAEAADIPTSELFASMDWLAPQEVVPWDPLRVAEQVALASTALDRLLPHVRRALATLDTSAPAPVVAAQALLADFEAAARFSVVLGKVISQGRYAAATNMTAEFRLRPGVAALTNAEADRLAARVGLPAGQLPDKRLREQSPDYWNTSIELRARTYLAMSELDVGQYSWQGEPGTTTWIDAAQSFPTHLLVQDLLGGAGWPAASTQWQPHKADTIVVVGGRPSTGPAAAVLAEALGWQFVPVRSDVVIAADGYVFSVQRDRATGRVDAWGSVARHIERRYADGKPWRAVVLVRPAAFLGRGDQIDDGALSLLATTPARIVYARPPREFLVWWAQRQQGAMIGRDLSVDRWVQLRARVLQRVEDVIASRDRATDLAVAIPAPQGALLAHSARVPGEVVDAHAQFAWTVIRWLDETPNAAGVPLLEQLRPGTLARWLPELRAQREPVLPRLSFAGRSSPER